jgi:hypothetical protein
MDRALTIHQIVPHQKFGLAAVELLSRMSAVTGHYND